MASPAEAIRGSASIELSDVLMLILVWHLKRFGIVLVVMTAFVGWSFWHLFSGLGLSGRDLPPGTTDLALASLRQSLVLLGGASVVLVAAFLLLRVVLLPWFALWRSGRERRTFTWVIDETGIRRTDGLGAQSLLPWSNIVKFRCERRMFWLKVKPRGWRYLLRRAFTTEDQERLRLLAARMIAVP